MITNRILLTIVLTLGCVTCVQSQSQTQYDKGTPPQHTVGVSSFGSYISAELGTINLSNGALNFKIPLGSVSGRGGLSIPLSLNYSSKVWSASMDTDIERESMTEQPVVYADYDRGLIEGGNLYSIIGAGWTIACWPSLDAKRVLIGKIPSGPNAGCYNYILTKLTLYLPDRGEMELRDDATDGAPLSTNCSGTTASRGTRWHATDGSGIIFINDVDNGVAQWPAPNLSGVIITADGTRIRFGPSGEMTDRNGNKITGLTDQLGRTTAVQYNVTDPENPSVTLAVLVTIPGYQGQNRYYKIKKGIMNANYRSGINPALPVITGDWDPEAWGYSWWGSPTRLFLKSYGLYAQRIDNLEILTELILPDGRSLKFKYNEFGEVAEVELPTGGRIQYDHAYRASLPSGNSPSWETGTNGAGSGIVTDVKWVDRAVSQKRTYPDGVTLEGTWNYSFASSNASVIVTSASGSLLSDTRHYFLPASRYTEYPWNPGNHDGSHYTLWSTGVEWRTESRDASGTVIAASEQDWTQRAAVTWSGYQHEQPVNDNRVNQARKYLDTGAMAKVETLYDVFNNPTEVKEYDFDQSMKRRTVATYSSTNLVNGVNYAADSIRLIRLPLEQSIYDGAGIEQTRTTYEYDIYTADGNHDSMLSYPSITGHDTANYGPTRTTRGNVTRIGNWIKTTNSFLYTYPRYDIAGNVVSTKDSRGFITTLNFTDDFGSGPNPGSGSQGANGATYAVPTLITSSPPNAGEQPHTARSQYDFSTGLLTGFKDRNGIITQTVYNDAFNRPTLVKSGLGISGVENHAAMYYAPSTTPFGITLDKNDVLAARDQANPDDAALRSWTRTDGFGRTTEAWSKDPQGDVKVAITYDAFGRSKQVTNPYRPSMETPVYTTSAFDLLGRVISVTTPDSAVVSTAYSGNTVTVTDQAGKARKSVADAFGRMTQVYEDPNGLNYLTSYSYDTLDSLTTVSQGSQTRTFVYDSLKRLTSATNPESGMVSYQYDNSGNLLVKTDARGVSSHFEYDALNRASRRWYNGSSSLTATTHNTPALPSGVGATDEVKYFYDSQSLPGGAPTTPEFSRGYATGRLVAVTYGGGSNGDYYGYDALGRVDPKIQRTGGVNYKVDPIHNLAGVITSLSYPSGRTITNTFDGAGRLSSFAGNLGDGTLRTYANDFQYTALNALQQEKFGTTTPIYHKQRFNSRGQLWDMRASTVSFASNPANGDRGAIVNYYSNSFTQGGSGTDNNGNLLRQENYIPGSSFFQDNFTYDSLNRLTSIAEKLNGTGTDSFKQVYVYDRWGNRTIDQVNTTPNVPKPNFGVNTSNNRLTAPAGYAMGYDAAGNLTNDTYTGQGARTYDAENRMSAAWANGQWQSYSYDADGHRARRKVNNVETWQVYGIGGELLAEYPANGTPTNPQKEYGYRNGELLVTTETSSGGGGSSAQPVIWTNAVGVAVNGNNLTKTAAESWGNAGASSTQSIASGDGYVETTMSETNKYRMIGLSNGDSHQNYTDIDFAIYPIVGGGLQVYEGGVLRGNVGSYSTGDTLRVAVEGGVVKYRKNGTLLYTSTVSPTYPLLVDTSLYSNGATLNNVVISGGGGGSSTQNASWTNSVGVAVNGNNLTKTAAESWGNAGASSTQSIASGDGYVETTISETNKYRMIGLSNGDSHQNYNDIDFAFYPAIGGTLYIYEGGTPRGTFGTYATGEVLRVAVEGGVVKYRKNGALLYTSTVTPTYPLLVDTSLYSNGATLNNVVISGAAGGGGSSSATVRWLVSDQLGTPRMIFDQTGSLATMTRHDYLPFGEELFAGTGGRTIAQGYTSNDNVRQKFTSKERDNESGLDYFLARYYSSTQGRFTSTDPIMISQDRIENPQALNLYFYTRNNPLKYVDPDGEEIIPDSTLSDAQRTRILESIVTLRKQSKAADKAFAVFDKPAGEGPNLHIGVLDDKTFKRLKGVPDKALAYATNEGGVLDGSGENYLVSHSRIDFRESSLSESNLEQEGRDRAQGRETLIEGILSHEIGHALDNALDRKGFDLRQEQDKNLKYHDRRNEIRADDTLGATRAERFFGGHVRGESFQSGLKFPVKEIKILRQ